MAAQGARVKRFDSTGARVAAEFMVNTYTSGNQSGTYAVYGNSAPAVGIDSAGDFVVAWHSNQQDGSGGGIFAQRYAQTAILDIDASGAIGALTDGLLVLRFMFGFTGATLTNGAVDLTNCTRCQADDIESYLELLL